MLLRLHPVTVIQCRAVHRSLRLVQPYSTEATPFTDAPAPPLLQKFKTDLKTALRARDTPRLNVLRGLLADITNASKTSSPIANDMQILNLLRKRAAAAKDAAEGFKAAGRQDLVQKEEEQRGVLEAYVGGVDVVGEEEVKGVVEKVVKELEAEEGKVERGKLLRRLIGPGGVFEGRNVEKTVVVRIAQEVTAK